MSSKPGRRLDQLTGLRFIAALGVVLHHGGTDIVGGRFGVTTFVGFVGVTFFFVLSGFVLTWSYRPGGGFYRRRVARVYPLHVLTWAIAIIFSLIVVSGAGSLTSGSGRSSVLADVLNLVLLQAWIPKLSIALSANGPSWSLSCEAFFYAIFPFVIAWAGFRRFSPGRALQLVVVLYLVVILGCAATGSGGFTLLYLNPLGRVVDFLLGIAIARAVQRGVRCPVDLPAALMITAGAVIVMALSVSIPNRFGWLDSRYLGDAAFLPFACLVVWAAASTERNPRFLASRTMVRLGVWSFALYLTHPIVFAIFEANIHLDQLSFAARLGIEILAVLIAVAVSGLAYHFVEAPLERRISGRVSSQDPAGRRRSQPGAQPASPQPTGAAAHDLTAFGPMSDRPTR